MSWRRFAMAAGLAAALAFARSSALPARDDAGASGGFAIVHANVIPMDSERVLAGRTLVISNGRIAAIAPDGAATLPAGTRVVDARGAYVLPGLIDMHVHVRSADLAAYVHAGITSVRNMWGYTALPALMQQIEGGAVLGPWVYSASPGLDGTPAVWPQTQIVDDPATADATVAAQVAAGWRFIKVYNSLSPESYDAIVASARARGIRVVGHVPNRVPVEHALDSGQSSIEHLRGYDLALTTGPQTATFAAWADIDASRIPDLAARTAAAGTWNCPTMAVFDALMRNVDPGQRARIVANRAAMIRALRDAGAGLLAGTDAGIDLSAPGVSMHDEISDLVAAGLTPYEALRAGTSGAAAFLQEDAEIGTVAAGRRADLVIVPGNPLGDVGELRSPVAVVLRGRWIALSGRSDLVPPVPARAATPRVLTRPSR